MASIENRQQRLVSLYSPEQIAMLEPLSLSDCLTALPPRNSNSHKGSYGHAGIVGGDSGMAGAVLIASEAAARVGAGLITCVTRACHCMALNVRCPEVMSHSADDGDIAALLKKTNALAVGPGLGQSEWGRNLLLNVLTTSQPLVVDADALNLLSVDSQWAGLKRDNWILTPHMAEAARLLSCSVADIALDRVAAGIALQQRFGGVVILKGAGSLVIDGASEAIGVCLEGNPGMASGGMGDLLSGILVGLLAQGLAPAKAARLGVCIHSYAADIDAKHNGQRGLLATDLLPIIRRLIG